MGTPALVAARRVLFCRRVGMRRVDICRAWLTATERRRHNKTPRSALACSRDELFEAAMGFVVGHLLGRMLAEIGGGGMKNAAVASVERELRAPDRVNCDAG